MKTKLSEWGNSHGIRINSAVIDHLNVKPGGELNIHLTDKGVEILKNIYTETEVITLANETIQKIIDNTEPVKTVSDPYSVSDTGYLVITINPCKPVIREVPIDTEGAYKTLTDAKEAARQAIQNAISESKQSLSDLRQIGVEKIRYIEL